MTNFFDTESNAAAEARAAGLAWPDHGAFPTFPNNVFALNELRIDLGFDVRAQRIVIKREGEKRFSTYNDSDESALRWRIRTELGYDPGKETLRDAIRHVAYANSFDPVWLYFLSLTWDQQSRLRTWVPKYLGAADTPLNRTIGYIMMIAAVRRARYPGCRFDLVPFLVGAQGKGKSRALRILAKRAAWFNDQEFLHLGPREQVESMLGAFIYELAERGGLHRTSAESYKATISRRSDRWRAAYARSVEDVPRRLVFWGTTNDAQFLRDTSGNRRFIPIKVGKIRLNQLRTDVDQLWAEAFVLEAMGCSISLPRELWGAAGQAQAAALEVDPWIEVLRELKGVRYRDEERVNYAIVFAFLGISRAGQTPAQLARASDCLKHHGWVRSGLKNVNGTTARSFTRPVVGEQQRNRGES
jgi:predicted P-loop ATPase